MTISATLPPLPLTEAPAAVRRLRHPHRWGLATLLTGTALLYIWGLSASGWANQFYAAAAQAGSKSWKAFLFGSLDQSNFITVDKPPASLWVMDISARIFGRTSRLIVRSASSSDREAGGSIVRVTVRR